MASFDLKLAGPAGLPRLPDPHEYHVPVLYADPDAFALVESRAHYFHDLRCITARHFESSRYKHSHTLSYTY